MAKDKYLEILNEVRVQGATVENSTQNLVELIKDLMTDIKEPLSTVELGIDGEKFTKMIPTMAAFASADICTFTSPRVPTTREFATILESMLKNKHIDF